MTLPVRLLGPGDEAALRGLNALYAEVFDEHETYPGAPPDEDYLRGVLAKPHIALFVAEDDGAVIGGLTLYLLDRPERAWSEGYIYDLGVAEPYRRQGIARRLIQAACDWSAARGAWVVYVQADQGDDPAIALYSSMGQREDVLHFDIPLSPATPPRTD